MASFEISPSILQCFSSSRGPCLQVAKPCQNFFSVSGVQSVSLASSMPRCFQRQVSHLKSCTIQDMIKTVRGGFSHQQSHKFLCTKIQRFQWRWRCLVQSEISHFHGLHDSSWDNSRKVSSLSQKSVTAPSPDDWLPSSGEITTLDARHGCERQRC